MTQSMTKSSYSQYNTDRKRPGFHQAQTLALFKAEALSQLALKKYHNKKFNKLVALIAYTVTSADKAIKLLDISCNFQAEFASKLYLSDRETLLKQLNAFSLDDLHQNKSIISTSEVKSIVMEQSLFQQSKQLRKQNEKLKKQLTALESQIARQQRCNILKSKSSYNFLSTQEISEYSALLLTKSCQFDLLREQYDFMGIEHRKMAELLKKICQIDQISDFLSSISQESKWKIEALNPGHMMQEKVKYQQLAEMSERRTQDLTHQIINKMQNISSFHKEKSIIEQELYKLRLQNEAISSNFISKCNDFALKEAEHHSKQARYSEEVIKLNSYIACLEQKLKNIQQSVLSVNNSKNINASTVQQIINTMGSKIKDYEKQVIIKAQLYQQNRCLLQDINKLQQQYSQMCLNSKQRNLKFQQNIKDLQVQKSKLQDELAEIKTWLNNKQAEIHHSNLSKNQLQQSIQELRQKCIAYENKIIKQSLISNQAEDLLQRLKQQLSQRQNRINQLLAEKDSISNEILLMQHKQIQNTQKMMILSKQLHLSKQEKQSLKGLIATNQHEISLIRSFYESAKDSHQAKVKQYEQNLACLHSVKEDLQHLLNDSRQKSSQTLKTYQNLIAFLKQDNQTVKQQNAEMKKVMEKLQEEVRNKNSSKLQLNEQLRQATCDKEQLKAQLRQQMENFKQRQQNLKALIAEQGIKLENQNKQILQMKYAQELLQQELTKVHRLFEEKLLIYNQEQQKFKAKSQQWSNEKQNLLNQRVIQQQKINQKVSQIQQLLKLHKNQHAQFVLILKEKDCQIVLLKQNCTQLQAKINDILTQKHSLQQSLKQLQVQTELETAQDKETLRQYSSELSRIKRQANLLQQRCKAMEIDKIIAQRYANDNALKYKSELATLQQDLKQRTSIHHREWQELSSTLILKQQELNDLQAKYHKLDEELKAQTAKPIQTQEKRSQLEEHVSLKQYFCRQNQKSQKQQQGSVQNGQNNFTDFGSYIEHKMEESFVSIIHSQSNNSDHSKAFQALAQLKQKKEEELQDEFEDFSSSQAEEVMYSMSSHNQSIEQPILTPLEPNKQILLPSTQLGSTTPCVEGSKLTYFCQGEMKAQRMGEKVEYKLRRTYSIIGVEDPVMEKDLLLSSSGKKQSSNNSRESNLTQ